MMRNLTKFMRPVREPENTLREPFLVNLQVLSSKFTQKPIYLFEVFFHEFCEAF